MSDAELPLRRGVAAVIVQVEKLLVIRRALTVEAPGAFCFPGGAIEAGESEEEALVREIREELGAIVRPLRRVWTCRTPWRVDLAWWRAELAEGAMLAPNVAEVDSIHWHTPAELRRLAGLLESNLRFLDALETGEAAL
jgi:8-oxo-dGTP pyrophosphatase MutT (NUDIX family)